MGTVQLQCGHCQKVMAISVEHLGGKVHCPHCQGVVQTQAQAPAPEPPPANPDPPTPSEEAHPRESIFAPPGDSDSVVGEPAPPKVEMPEAAASSDSAATPSEPFLPPAQPMPAETPSAPEEPFAAFKPRPVYDSGVLTMYAFIFLIPYAILTTLAVIYLLFFQGPRTHPLDMMPDPEPKKGGAKPITRIDRAFPLADHQKTTLGQAIRVGKDGDLMVTPEKVVLTKELDLKIFLRAKNVSTNATFAPIHQSFVRFEPAQTDLLPYSYLESKSKSVRDVHNLFVDKGGDKMLRPNEEIEIVLSTDFDYREKVVPRIAAAKDSYTWRLQMRRGLVKWRGKDVSATAVIAVEFTSEQIQREPG
ncbi:MAG: hypothetical protein HYR84_16210 [Planctomycetes bacterium]|nr:hypothetical protein [Planctomycetota bacterium]